MEESMTERFTMCHQQNDKYGWTMSIVDWETEQPFDYTQYEVHSGSITDTKDEMEDLCLLLNQMNEENEQLKHDASILVQSNSDYRNENEQLKTRLHEERELAMRLSRECDTLTIKKQELELEIIRLEEIIKTGNR